MKQYVKPDLLVENFELSKHIATCDWDMSNLNDGDSCVAKPDPMFGFDDDFTKFTGTNPNCIDTEDYCYTNGQQSGNVFNS